VQTSCAWWCGAAGRAYLEPQRVVILSEPNAGGQLRDLLAEHTAGVPGIVVLDRSDEWSAITVVGAATGDVLRSLGVYGRSGNPREVPPLQHAPIGDLDAIWLLVSDHRALAVVATADADAAWHAIEAAGRPRHICCVGQDAIARYELLQRRGSKTVRS
jgi:hypothetical protein